MNAVNAVVAILEHVSKHPSSQTTNLGLFLIHQEPEVGHAKPQNYIFLEADAPHTSQTTFARICGEEH